MSGQQLKVPPPLSAQDKSSFAYKTIKDRLPVILVKTIDFFHRQRKELFKFGGTINVPTDVETAEIEKDAKEVIAYLSKLRKELETNKPVDLIEKLDLSSELARFNEDVDIWNGTLNSNKLENNSLPSWFDSPWLLVECYLYRRIKDAMLRTRHLKMFDPFVEQKQTACRSAKPQMVVISHHLTEVEKTVIESTKKTHPSERKEFSIFMQLALWANKSDLSISGMSADKIQLQKAVSDIRETLDELQENILCDNLSEVWFKVQAIKEKIIANVGSQERGNNPGSPMYIDLVADNSGYELFVDLCLVDFLGLILSQDSKIIKFRIHVKRMPWFVSDTVKHDVDWLIDFMTAPDQESTLQAFGRTWKAFIENGLWEIHDHLFWTLPHDFSEMESVSRDLYSLLQTSSLIIFKGDLNYRKLTGDRKWHLLTPFRAALRGFGPAPLVALRTAKADVVVGIEDINIFAQINNNELPRDWMISGNYGLIQYVDLS